MEKQVSKESYSFEKYVYMDRWASYHYQLREIAATGAKTMLEIGPGDEVVSDYAKKHFGIHYTSVDIADDLKPDVIGSADNLPFKDASFDLVAAFEVLEHIPFEKFDQCLSEIARVTKQYALISIPHFAPPVTFSLKLPFLPKFQFAFKIPYPKTHVFNGQHYWEVGKKGYSRANVRSHFEKYFHIDKEFVPFENQYHRFYVLRKKQ